MIKQRVGLLIGLILVTFTTPAFGQVQINEQFNGNSVDTNIFTFSSAGDESFFGRTQLNSPDLPGAFDEPEVSDGNTQTSPPDI